MISMLEIFVGFLEGALKPANIVFAVIFALIVSLVTGAITRKFDKFFGLVVFGITLFIQYLLYNALFDMVQSEQTKYVEKQMYSILDKRKFDSCKHTDKNITNWREGFKKLEGCPREIGYLITTADYLVNEYKNYEAASLLLELSLDYLPTNPMPTDVCARLINYYNKLPEKRISLDSSCIKVINAEH
jgi:hypothetical protein